MVQQSTIDKQEFVRTEPLEFWPNLGVPLRKVYKILGKRRIMTYEPCPRTVGYLEVNKHRLNKKRVMKQQRASVRNSTKIEPIMYWGSFQHNPVEVIQNHTVALEHSNARTTARYFRNVSHSTNPRRQNNVKTCNHSNESPSTSRIAPQFIDSDGYFDDGVRTNRRVRKHKIR